jgi:hypothetical protein
MEHACQILATVYYTVRLLQIAVDAWRKWHDRNRLTER